MIIINRFNYDLALRKATTVAECQDIYNHEVATKLRQYKAKFPLNYYELVVAYDIDDWIKAENRAQRLIGHHHVYGSLIRRRFE